MQITTNTLKALARHIGFALVALSVIAVSACEQAVIATAQSDARRPAAVAEAEVIRGRVVAVADGDTVTVLDGHNTQHRIRLAEIDAPERGQPWANRSKQALSDLVFGKSVLVRQTDVDRYGRVVGRIFVGETDVSREMVEQGAAWAYRRYLTDQTILASETRARRARVGLWSMSEAQTVTPWEWRRGARAGGQGGEAPLALPLVGTRKAPATGGGGFTCGGKRFCREMSSCAEAHFYLRQCGVRSLDGNKDGQPCEMLCGTNRR